MGDNGTPPQVIQTPYTSAHAKDSLNECGTRVPLIIAGAGVVNPNRDSTALVGLVDLYATILDLAGINATATPPAANNVDAKSLLPLLQNKADTARFAFSQQFGGTLTAAASGQTLREAPDFKLIEFADRHEEFYELNVDPDEQNNLPIATLNATQLASYHGLKLEMTKYQGTLTAPAVQSMDLSGPQATVRVAKTSGVTTYTLYHSTGLTTYGTWLPVNGATVVEEGSAVAPRRSRRERPRVLLPRTGAMRRRADAGGKTIFPSYGNFISPVEKRNLRQIGFAWLIWRSRSCCF